MKLLSRLVENPITITLKDLMSEYNNVTYPITLVCAGNRRKEQNVVRKTKGFSWGAAGVSTALFTGVVMSDVIRRAKPLRKARYVCMEGADKLVSVQRHQRSQCPLTKLAERFLRHISQAELGNGPQPRDHASTWNERRNSTAGSWQAFESRHPRTDWR